MRLSKRRRSSSSGERRRRVDRKRDRKRNDKKKHKKHHKKRKHSSSSQSEGSLLEDASEESGVGPQVPEDFYEKQELKEAQQRENVDGRPDMSTLLQSYRRPRRQKAQDSVTVLHP